MNEHASILGLQERDRAIGGAVTGTTDERAPAALREDAAHGVDVPQIAGASDTLHACAQSLRRLIMLENGVLIPLARRCLLQEDIAALSARLAVRRRAKSA